MEKFSWLHFSDLHFRRIEGMSSENVRTKMYDKLRTLENVNYVFITGDVADKGVYDGVEHQLHELAEHINCKGGDERLFWVVGNHDIKRFDRKTKFINAIRKAPNMIYAFDEAMVDDEKLLDLGRLGYKDYLKQNMNLAKDPSFKATVGSHNDELHKIIELPELNLIMLNTCLLSCDEVDEGRLCVLDKDFRPKFDRIFSENEVRKMIKNKKPTFVIAHHGGKFLHDKESERLRKLFAGKVDLYLCGHSHKLMYDKFYDPDKHTDVEKQQQIIHQYTCGIGTLDNQNSVPTFLYGEYSNGQITVKAYRYNGNVWEEHIGRDAGKRILLERFRKVGVVKNGYKLFITGVQSAGKTMVSKRLTNALINSEALQIAEVDLLKDGFRKDISMLEEKLAKRNMKFCDFAWLYGDVSFLDAVLETSYRLGIEGIEKQSEYLFPRLMNALERHTEKGIPAIIEGLNIPIDKLIEYYRDKKEREPDFDLRSINIVNLCVNSIDTLRQHIESRVEDRQQTGEERKKQEDDLPRLWEINQYLEQKTEKIRSENPDMYVRNIDNSGIRINDKDMAVDEIIQMIDQTGNFV